MRTFMHIYYIGSLTMSRALQLIAFVALLTCVLANAKDGYRFPDRFECVATGFIYDALVGFDPPGQSIGYMYTDYTIPAQRVDETWQYNSIYGSSFMKQGILADTHYYYDGSNHLVYRILHRLAYGNVFS
eukprot:TRINITY_DN211_c0_g1_i20.p1 TRINITY_DN211_c0_g1~~TRINITY_DN211_c0_g1_i20.p1  ORF type:complete len:130 (-),score=12.14 TRINITY_DN211_c0_g1_i20:2-391(-)